MATIGTQQHIEKQCKKLMVDVGEFFTIVDIG